MRRIVEAFSEGEVVYSCLTAIDEAGACGADFIERAIEFMVEQGFSPPLIDRWEVRKPRRRE